MSPLFSLDKGYFWKSVTVDPHLTNTRYKVDPVFSEKKREKNKPKQKDFGKQMDLSTSTEVPFNLTTFKEFYNLNS